MMTKQDQPREASHISDLSGTIEGHLDILLHEFLPIPSKMTSVGSISLNV